MADAYDSEISETRRFTYADYLKWDDSERRQLINGEVYMMSSPSVVHQALQGAFFYRFYDWLKEKSCKVFAAPLMCGFFQKRT